ncbi:MAG TPA: GLUG motif-containing protein, partial [Syntrophales bacterium]|nr:GLUG motif-containing protein [Syntrophales bacterium]
GGLVGTGGGYITRSFATGNVMDISGASMTSMGGLVGYMLPGSITDSYATGSVTGKNSGMGGLVGRLNQASIENSFATGNVTNDWGGGYTGGLVGTNGGSITDSWASGNVYGAGIGTGGLAGISAGSITNCHATGNVQGADIETGGLVGAMFAGTITNSYALGDVTGTDIVGGLVGWFLSGSSIDGSYAGGRVTGTGQSVGGLVGQAVHHAAVIPSITNSYWNAGKSGQSNVVGKGATDVTITNTRGLTDSQWSDLPYYRDGTIDQVLADRAAAAARQAAFEAGARNLADSTVGQTMQRDTNPSSGAATLDEGQRQPSLDDHIVFADSADYGAHIKAISADGVYFDLEDDSDDRKKRKNE